jgi:hypothetical protein
MLRGWKGVLEAVRLLLCLTCSIIFNLIHAQLTLISPHPGILRSIYTLSIIFKGAPVTLVILPLSI